MSVARYTKGLTNVDSGETMSQFLSTDPTKGYGYWNDFYTYAATDWVLTTQETGAATEAIADDEVTGVLKVTNGTADTDHDNFQLSKDGGTGDSETFLFATKKKAWFKTRLKANLGASVTIHVGLHITNTDPVATAPTDGVYFKILGGAITCVVRKDSVSTTTSTLATLGNDTFVALGYYWDGVDTFHIYVNDQKITTSVSTNMPDDETLAISFGVENATAGAKVMEVDYIGAWMER